MTSHVWLYSGLIKKEITNFNFLLRILGTVSLVLLTTMLRNKTFLLKQQVQATGMTQMRLVVTKLLLIILTITIFCSGMCKMLVFILQLIIGDFSLSYEQAQAQFAIWAVMASVCSNCFFLYLNYKFLWNITNCSQLIISIYVNFSLSLCLMT